MRRKLLAAILAGMMMLSLLPTSFATIAMAVETPTPISDRAGLKTISGSGSYLLTADIDLAGEDWTPLAAFSGTLDGGDHIIKNLSITDTTELTGNNKGLFASIASGGTVKNLGMVGVNITAGNNTGAIAGTNGGTISRCYTTGTVSGNSNLGGLVGVNAGTIENCYSRVSVSGNSNLGGLVGNNFGTISKSYAASAVTDSVMNNYLQFDGDGHIEIPHNNAYSGNAFTLEAWFQWDKVGSDLVDFIIGKGYEQFEIHTGGDSGENGLRFIPVPQGGTSTTPDGYNGDSYIDVHNVLQAGWFHVATVYWYENGTAYAKVYVNGEEQNLWQGRGRINDDLLDGHSAGTTATLTRSSNPLAANTVDISIGCRTNGGSAFNGKIADVRFWNTARTGEQIKANKDKVLNGTEAGLVGYWKLNDSLSAPLAGQQVADATANSNNGTIYGSVTQTTSAGSTFGRGALTGSNTGSGSVSDCFYDSTLFGSIDGGAGTAASTTEMKTPSTYAIAGWGSDTTWKLESGKYPNLGFKTVSSVTVTPATAGVKKSKTQRFSASVTGENDYAQTVTWTVEGKASESTTISADGLLTVAAGETAKTLTVRATSTGNTAKSGTATVTVQENTPTYTVNYNGNKPSGATGSVAGMPAAGSRTYDVAFNLGAAPTLTGYTFDGWYKDAACTKANRVGDAGNSVKNLSATDDATVTLYAKWTANEYAVTLDGQGATTAGTTSIPANYDAKPPSITVPQRDYTVTFEHNGGTGGAISSKISYIFDGYFSEIAGGTKYYDADGQSAGAWDIDDNATLYAHWTAGSNLLPAPEKLGFAFVGWYTDADFTNFAGAGGAAYTPTADVTLYAKWTAKAVVEDRPSAPSAAYHIVDGQGSEWTQGSRDVVFTADGDYTKFTGVSVDNTLISNDKYTSKKGSTIVTLKTPYLKTLSSGRHTLRVNFTDGYAETHFTIKDATGIGSPNTGDNTQPALWLGLMLLAGAGLTVVGRKRRQDG